MEYKVTTKKQIFFMVLVIVIVGCLQEPEYIEDVKELFTTHVEKAPWDY